MLASLLPLKHPLLLLSLPAHLFFTIKLFRLPDLFALLELPALFFKPIQERIVDEEDIDEGHRGSEKHHEENEPEPKLDHCLGKIIRNALLPLGIPAFAKPCRPQHEEAANLQVRPSSIPRIDAHASLRVACKRTRST